MNIASLIRDRIRLSLTGTCRIFNLTGSAAALFLAVRESPFAAVENDESSARALMKDILFYRALIGTEGPVFFLPDPDGPDASGARTDIMYRLRRSDSITTSSKNLYSTLWDGGSLAENMLLLKKGALTDRSTLEGTLVRFGYSREAMVAEKGEYSRREWIIDIQCFEFFHDRLMFGRCQIIKKLPVFFAEIFINL